MRYEMLDYVASLDAKLNDNIAVYRALNRATEGVHNILIHIARLPANSLEKPTNQTDLFDEDAMLAINVVVWDRIDKNIKAIVSEMEELGVDVSGLREHIEYRLRVDSD